MNHKRLFGIGLDTDYVNINTAEALGFSISSSMLENPFIIPDVEETIPFLKARPIATA
jgi:hypothetical protein